MIKILSVFIILIFNSICYCQLINIPLRITDGTISGTDTLRFGLDPSATDGIDTALGEYQLPPMPPTGIFDARFIGYDLTPPLPLGQGTSRDYRQGTATYVGTKIHELKFQRGTGTSITISWNLPSGVNGRIFDLFGGAVVNDSIYGAGSTTIYNAAISTLFMRINYALTTLPSTPILISPLNGSTGLTLTPLLDWSNVVNATHYHLLISTESSTIIDEDSIVQSYYQVPNGLLAYYTLYFWKVRAINEAGTGPWSTNWNFTTLISSIKLINSEVPHKYKLYQNYPNPFNPSTNIKFDISKSTFVNIIIYNALGIEVTTLVNKKLSAGSYQVDWDARHRGSSGYASAVYFYKLITEECTETRKMILMK